MRHMSGQNFARASQLTLATYPSYHKHLGGILANDRLEKLFYSRSLHQIQVKGV